MLQVFATVISVGSGLFLFNDNKNRNDFNKFKKNKRTQDGYELIEGVIKSNEPLENAANPLNKLAIVESKTKIKSYHTHYENKLVIQSGDDKIKIPIPETTVDWKTNGITLLFAPNLKFNEFPINFTDDARFNWESYFTVKDGDIKKINSFIKNDVVKTVFAKKIEISPGETQEKSARYQAEVIGNNEQVLSDVRWNKYGISNWTTFFASAAGAASIAYLIESCVRNK
jgi:hypothetical protein